MSEEIYISASATPNLEPQKNEEDKIVKIRDEPSIIMRNIYRFFSPRFEDEIKLWFSTIPILSGIVQIILIFISGIVAISKMAEGLNENPTVNRGGLGGFATGVIFIGIFIGIILALTTGLFSLIGIVSKVAEISSLIIPICLIICLIGTIFKNTFKLQQVGAAYEFKHAYIAAFVITAILVLIFFIDAVSNGTLPKSDRGRELIDPVWLPLIGTVSAMITFHAFVKPILNSIFITSIALGIKPSEKISQEIQHRKETRNKTMSKFWVFFRFIRYSFVVISGLFFIAIPLLKQFGVDEYFLLLNFDIPLPLSVANNIVLQYFFSFFTAILIWCSVIAIFSPSNSFFMKLLHLFKVKAKENTNSTVNIAIIAVGFITLFSTLYALNNDMHIYPNDPQAREASSLIYNLKKETGFERLDSRFFKRQDEALIMEQAEYIYQHYNQAGKNDINIDKIINYVVPNASHDLFGLSSIFFYGSLLAIAFGFFTRSPQLFVAYIVCLVLIPFVDSFVISGSDTLFLEVKTNFLEKTHELYEKFQEESMN